MYLLGSLAISVVVPDATLELTSGASQAFTAYADGFGVPGLSNVLLRACWWSGRWRRRSRGSRARAGACGSSGGRATCPRGLQKTNKNDVQMPLLLLQGAVVTVLSFVFVVAPNTSSAFAVLQDISISLYMLMYVCMFAAAIKLRRSQPDIERPIRIPGLPVIAVVGILAAISAIVLGLTPPSGYTSTPVAGVRRHRRHGRARARHPAAVHLPVPSPVMVHRRRGDRGAGGRRLASRPATTPTEPGDTPPCSSSPSSALASSSAGSPSSSSAWGRSRTAGR